MRKDNKKGKMTLERLASMTAKGFSELSERMDKKFDAVDKRFEQVDKRFEQVDRKFDMVNDRFSILEDKMESIQWDVTELVNKTEGTDVEIKKI